MKIVYILPLLFSLVAADEDIEVDSVSDFKLQGAKIELPAELVEELKLYSLNLETSIPGIVAVVDTYADKVLINIRNLILRNGLDPVELPDNTLNLIPTGTITLTSGWLQDTSTISRNGNVTVSYSSSTNFMELSLPIKFNSLMFTYEYLTKVLLLSIKGDVIGKVENLKINVKLGFDYGTYQASLDHFDIADTGNLSLKFTGNDLVDWITNAMTSVVGIFLHPIIIAIVETMVKGALQTAVQVINSFIDGLLHS